MGGPGGRPFGVPLTAIGARWRARSWRLDASWLYQGGWCLTLGDCGDAERKRVIVVQTTDQVPNSAEAPHASAEQRTAMGKAARATTPLAAHAEFRSADSRDPIGLLLRQAETRVPELVPIRHGRMLVSPFAFFRGAALVM